MYLENKAMYKYDNLLCLMFFFQLSVSLVTTLLKLFFQHFFKGVTILCFWSQSMCFRDVGL